MAEATASPLPASDSAPSAADSAPAVVISESVSESSVEKSCTADKGDTAAAGQLDHSAESTSADRLSSTPDDAAATCTDGQSEPSASAPSSPSTEFATGEAPLSKRQRKRLAKREAFLAQRPALRRAERQRRKEKRAAAVAAALAAGTAPPKRPRLAPMASGSGVQVVIDLSFDALMTERDLGKCLKQVQRCYAANRRAARPVQLALTSMEGESRRLMDANDGWQNWDVRIEREHLLDVLPPETVTYLSSDSEHQLDALVPGRAYVIGGLVDHNHHKGECLRRAREAGIAHARLPIDDFVEMKTRKVLTIDHVFSILLLVAGGCGWQQALQQVLPARKGAVPKEAADGGADAAANAEAADGDAETANGDAEAADGDAEMKEGIDRKTEACDASARPESEPSPVSATTEHPTGTTGDDADPDGTEEATGMDDAPGANLPGVLKTGPAVATGAGVCAGPTDPAHPAGDGERSVERSKTNGAQLTR